MEKDDQIIKKKSDARRILRHISARSIRERKPVTEDYENPELGGIVSIRRMTEVKSGEFYEFLFTKDGSTIPGATRTLKDSVDYLYGWRRYWNASRKTQLQPQEEVEEVEGVSQIVFDKKAKAKERRAILENVSHQNADVQNGVHKLKELYEKPQDPLENIMLGPEPEMFLESIELKLLEVQRLLSVLSDRENTHR